MKEILSKVVEATGTSIGVDDLKKMVSAFMTAGDFWVSLPLIDQPFNVAAETAKVLHEKGYIEFKGTEIILTEEGKRWAEENYIKPLIISTCERCSGRGISLELFSEVLERFKEIAKSRPSAIVDYDQGYVTPETTVSRVALLAQKGDIQGKDLFVLGDDDLLSIAAALSGFPKRVVVVEIDERIVKFIEDVSKAEGLNIEAIPLDLRNPLPESVLKSFDTFWTDPPETVEALELFVGRGIAGLKGPGCAGYFGVTYSESDRFKWRKFQQVITGRLGAVITDMIPNFNEYVNWDYLLDTIRNDIEPLRFKPSINWYRSTQYRIVILEDTPIFNEPATGKEIYVDKDALVYTGKFREEE